MDDNTPSKTESKKANTTAVVVNLRHLDDNKLPTKESELPNATAPVIDLRYLDDDKLPAAKRKKVNTSRVFDQETATQLASRTIRTPSVTEFDPGDQTMSIRKTTNVNISVPIDRRPVSGASEPANPVLRQSLRAKPKIKFQFTESDDDTITLPDSDNDFLDLSDQDDTILTTKTRQRPVSGINPYSVKGDISSASVPSQNKTFPTNDIRVSFEALGDTETTADKVMSDFYIIVPNMRQHQSFIDYLVDMPWPQVSFQKPLYVRSPITWPQGDPIIDAR